MLEETMWQHVFFQNYIFTNTPISKRLKRLDKKRERIVSKAIHSWTVIRANFPALSLDKHIIKKSRDNKPPAPRVTQIAIRYLQTFKRVSNNAELIACESPTRCARFDRSLRASPLSSGTRPRRINHRISFRPITFRILGPLGNLDPRNFSIRTYAVKQ